MRLGRVLAAGALGLLPIAASAQDTGAQADILGDWVFEAPSSPSYPSCEMTGRATIRPGQSPHVFECSLVAREVCPWSDYTAQQSCVAIKQGDRLRIDSVVVASEQPPRSFHPADFTYYPDNFTLRIIDSAHMDGVLDTAGIVTGARFFREEGPVA